MHKHLITRNRLTAAALFGIMITPLSALAAEISVPMDQVRMITFPVPIATVFVGNPLIADVTVIDPTRVFLMGKNFGSTNLIAVDQNGEQVVNDQITVQTRGSGVVTLHRGTKSTTMTCVGGNCRSAPVPGDSVEDFTNVTEQMGAREQGVVVAARGGNGQ